MEDKKDNIRYDAFFIKMYFLGFKKEMFTRHLIPALRRQRQGNLCEFEASLVDRVSFRTNSYVERETLSQK